jgi:hypothetical protein
MDFGKIGDKLIASVKAFAAALRAKLPAFLPLPILICAGAAFLLIVFLVVFIATRSGRQDAAQASVQGSAVDLSIPADEIFIPAEPDFVPGRLLDHEPRGAWGAEEAAPYWEDL